MSSNCKVFQFDISFIFSLLLPSASVGTSCAMTFLTFFDFPRFGRDELCKRKVCDSIRKEKHTGNDVQPLPSR